MRAKTLAATSSSINFEVTGYICTFFISKKHFQANVYSIMSKRHYHTIIPQCSLYGRFFHYLDMLRNVTKRDVMFDIRRLSSVSTNLVYSYACV